MNANAFDRYLEGASAVHRLDPRVKVLVTLAFIVAVALLPDAAWVAYGAAALLIGAATVAATLSPGLVVRRSLLGLPFLLAAVTVLFTVPGRALWSGPWGLEVTDAGLMRFGSIVARSLLSVAAAVLLTATTRFPDVLHALRHLRVPAVLVGIIAFMYRYLFVLVEEVQRLLRARAARSARLPDTQGGGSVGWGGGGRGSTAGAPAGRALDRSERHSPADDGRGVAGRGR